MATVTIAEAQARLSELIHQLATGEELVITENARPVAKLIKPTGDALAPVFGRGQGKVIVVTEDEDHLADFEDYMP